jgi:hypothetical protein
MEEKHLKKKDKNINYLQIQKKGDPPMKDKLPIGIENFEEIRTEGFCYVDKTCFIKKLLNN